MQRQGLRANMITYNSLIIDLCSDGKLDEAISLRNEMLGLGVMLNVVTFNVLTNGFCKNKMIKEATELFDDIRKQGLAPNAIRD